MVTKTPAIERVIQANRMFKQACEQRKPIKLSDIQQKTKVSSTYICALLSLGVAKEEEDHGKRVGKVYSWSYATRDNESEAAFAHRVETEARAQQSERSKRSMQNRRADKEHKKEVKSEYKNGVRTEQEMKAMSEELKGRLKRRLEEIQEKRNGIKAEMVKLTDELQALHTQTRHIEVLASAVGDLGPEQIYTLFKFALR